MTCGSGPGVVGHIDALRRNTYVPVRIIVGDVSTDQNAGFALADGRVSLPSAGDPELVDTLLAICRQYGVDVVWPVFDGELEPLAAARRRFEGRHVQLLLAGESTVRLCLDKAAFHERLAEAELSPPFRIVHSGDELQAAVRLFGYPERRVAVKPARGAGGRGFHVLDAHFRIGDHFFSSKPDSVFCTLETVLEAMSHRRDAAGSPLLVMPYLEGREYGCDALTEDGRIVLAVTRDKHPPVHEGMHTQILVGEDPEVLGVAERVVAAVRAEGLISIDLRADADGRLWVLEINPRAGAYLGMACERIDLIGLALARLYERKRDADVFRRTSEQIVGLRYWADLVQTDEYTRILATSQVLNFAAGG